MQRGFCHGLLDEVYMQVAAARFEELTTAPDPSGALRASVF